ncbi:MAG: peptidylprolyl isomerase [Bacteroidetes bacterium]|nr:peptidylprolyl isomerase [Bacteroidota bacterium]
MHASTRSVLFGLFLTASILWATGCGSSDPLRSPSLATMAQPAPDSFDVEMVTSAGTIQLRLYRDWSPKGVDRAFYLFRNNYYEGTRFYRVIDGFVAQFGGSGEADVDSIWRSMAIQDEPVRASNKRGTISFARAGRNSRNTTMYINLVDNTRLDSLDAGGVVGYPPIGRIIGGMAAVDSLNGEYGAAPMRTDLTANVLRAEYPRLDSIAATRVTRMW